MAKTKWKAEEEHEAENSQKQPPKPVPPRRRELKTVATSSGTAPQVVAR